MSDKESPTLILKKMSIQNYKIHKNAKNIPFKPITILLGPNSSGKSSLIHPLLILKQSFESTKALTDPIVINDDEFLKLGSFRDIVYNHNVKYNISFIFDMLNDKNEEIKYLFKIGYSNKTKKIILREINIYNITQNLRYIVKKGKHFILDNDKEIFSYKFSNETTIREVTLMTMLIFLSTVTGTENKIQIKDLKLDVDNESKEKIIIGSSLLNNLQTFLHGIQYIGPLRIEPQRFYQVTGESSLIIGSKGQKMSELIYRQFSNNNKKIIDIIRKWLIQLNVGTDIKLKFLDEDKTLYSIVVIEPINGIEVNVCDIGFGVSQIMPIMIAACLAPEHSTIILEQPEIHLHPLAQMILADIIIESSKNNRHFIIETHSEHLLLRFQRRISEKILDSSNIVINYFNTENKKINIINLNVDEKGLMEDIPEGFMDERLEELYKIALNE